MATPITPKPTGTFDLGSLLSSAGLSKDQVAAAMSKFTPGAAKKKQGVYTRVEQTTSVPDALTIEDNINQIYQKYYKRDATPDELRARLPEALAQYKDPKTGVTKAFVESTYNNGILTGAKTLTYAKKDINAFIEDSVKADLLSGKAPVNKLGMPEGPAGTYYTTFKQFASNHGLPLTDATARQYGEQVAGNAVSQDEVLNQMRESAANLYPQYADKIKAGVSLKTLADPYIQSMSNILELPVGGIDLYNNTIKNALNYKGPDGKPATQSLYDFETSLRNDPRWNYTQNARKSLDNVGLQVLKNFGLAS
jgi:hypothetical protein